MRPRVYIIKTYYYYYCVVCERESGENNPIGPNKRVFVTFNEKSLGLDPARVERSGFQRVSERDNDTVRRRSDPGREQKLPKFGRLVKLTKLFPAASVGQVGRSTETISPFAYRGPLAVVELNDPVDMYLLRIQVR